MPCGGNRGSELDALVKFSKLSIALTQRAVEGLEQKATTLPSPNTHAEFRFTDYKKSGQ